MSDTALAEQAEALPTPAATLFGSSDPAAIVARASEVASALADVIAQRGLSKRIGGRDHLLIEAWTLLGSMLGVYVAVEWTRPIDRGWEARAVARTLNGAMVGAAEAMCSHDERTWSQRDEYALRSMAQTRASSKALRLPLGYIVELAGYSATPAEEMAEPSPQPAARPQISLDELRDRVYAAGQARGISSPDVDYIATEHYGAPVSELDHDELLLLGKALHDGKYDPRAPDDAPPPPAPAPGRIVRQEEIARLAAAKGLDFAALELLAKALNIPKGASDAQLDVLIHAIQTHGSDEVLDALPIDTPTADVQGRTPEDPPPPGLGNPAPPSSAPTRDAAEAAVKAERRASAARERRARETHEPTPVQETLL